MKLINKFNHGINRFEELSKDKKKLVKQMLIASRNNVVFVNFYKEGSKESL